MSGQKRFMQQVFIGANRGNRGIFATLKSATTITLQPGSGNFADLDLGSAQELAETILRLVKDARTTTP